MCANVTCVDPDVRDGDLLWTPGPGKLARSNLTAFTGWLGRERGLRFDDYAALWRWSVTDLEAFWRALWDYFADPGIGAPTRVLGSRSMPGARVVPRRPAELCARCPALRGRRADALLYLSEPTALHRAALGGPRRPVRILATRLRALGVLPGDRVAASVMPNIPQTIIAMLATTAIGAIWASCSPDFGERGVLDRFAQLAPKVLFCVDGYRYGGKAFDRRGRAAQIAAGLPSARAGGVPCRTCTRTTAALPSRRR